MGAGALRNSVREGRDAGMGRFHRFLALLGCTSRVLWLSYWAPHLLLPEVEPVRRFLEPRIEPLLEPPGQVRIMARAAGLNKEDGSSIIKVFERMAGVTIGGDDD